VHPEASCHTYQHYPQSGAVLEEIFEGQWSLKLSHRVASTESGRIDAEWSGVWRGCLLPSRLEGLMWAPHQWVEPPLEMLFWRILNLYFEGHRTLFYTCMPMLRNCSKSVTKIFGEGKAQFLRQLFPLLHVEPRRSPLVTAKH